MQCFQCSGIQKPCKILLCTMFFSFLAVFPLPESYQNDPKFHFKTPKNPRKMSKTPPYSGLGAKPFLAPPPAKADIATAILTNVIEHLVLLLPPNKHAFTAKAVWADFWHSCYSTLQIWATHFRFLPFFSNEVSSFQSILLGGSSTIPTTLEVLQVITNPVSPCFTNLLRLRRFQHDQ